METESIKFILSIVQVVLAVLLMVVILLQSSKRAGLGTIAGTAETFFGKNKGRTIDARLGKATVVIAILIAASTIALNVL